MILIMETSIIAPHDADSFIIYYLLKILIIMKTPIAGVIEIILIILIIKITILQ